MSASKFTPETREAILERVAAGVSLADTARAVGVREKTLKNWITRGNREQGSEFAEFAAELDEARQRAHDRPGPLTREEFELRLSEAVRGGSVTAMKLWADLHVTPQEPAREAVDEFDELKARRARRG